MHLVIMCVSMKCVWLCVCACVSVCLCLCARSHILQWSPLFLKFWENGSLCAQFDLVSVCLCALYMQQSTLYLPFSLLLKISSFLSAMSFNYLSLTPPHSHSVSSLSLSISPTSHTHTSLYVYLCEDFPRHTVCITHPLTLTPPITN